MRAAIGMAMGLVLATVAQAPVLRRCESGDGAVSWQSAPCADGARESAVREVTPDAPAPSIAVAPATASSSPRARTPARRAAPAAVDRRARCDTARRAADARRDAEWNRLDFAERSRLDADVAKACAR